MKIVLKCNPIPKTRLVCAKVKSKPTLRDSGYTHPSTHLLLFILFHFWEGWVRETSMVSWSELRSNNK
jgi:hypothetical protein